MAEVKIDEELLERIKKTIKEGENRFNFPTVKTFVDKSVLKMLKNYEKKEKKFQVYLPSFFILLYPSFYFRHLFFDKFNDFFLEFWI